MKYAILFLMKFVKIVTILLWTCIISITTKKKK